MMQFPVDSSAFHNSRIRSHVRFVSNVNLTLAFFGRFALDFRELARAHFV